jgi:hypothetical protein
MEDVSPHPTDALSITDAQEQELLRLWGVYQREADRCRAAKAYLAGCVMAGSVLETELVLMTNIYPDEAIATGKCPQRKGVIKPLLEWNLSELIRVAKAAGWLPSSLEYGKDDWDSKKAEAGDYAEIVRETRNLAHPARYVEDHYRRRVTEKRLKWIIDLVKFANDNLLERVETNLTEYMKAQGYVPRRKRRSK